MAEFDILYGTGISHEGSLVDMGVAHKIVNKSGSWFSYGEMRIGQGRENARQYLIDNPDVAREIEEKIRAAVLQEKEEKEKKDEPAPQPAAENE